MTPLDVGVDEADEDVNARVTTDGSSPLTPSSSPSIGSRPLRGKIGF